MQKRWVFLMGLLVAMHAFSEQTFSAAFLDGTNLGASNVQQPSQALAQLNPSAVFTNYNANPSQSQYFQGGTQSTTNLSQAAANTFATDPNSQVILSSFMQRPDMRADTHSEGMQKSKLITNDAANIVNGISDEFIDCTKTQQCTPTFTTSMCNEPAHQGSQVCSKNLVVQAIPAQTVSSDLSIHVIGGDTKDIKLTVDLASGTVVSQSGTIKNITVSGSTGNLQCDGLSAKITQVSTSSGTVASLSVAPTCANHGQASLSLTKNWRHLFSSHDATITLHVTGKSPEVITDEWQNACTGLEQEAVVGVCSLQKEVCTEGAATNVINGVRVSRDCWQKQLSYVCGQASPSDNNCQPLRDQGCEQLNSTCKTKIGDVCVVYDQTYRCPSQKCTGGEGVVCNGSTFCLQGDCTNTTRTPDKNFSKSASELNAGADASQQYSGTIFKGASQTCGDDEAGYSNCCRDSGWGQDANLAHCSPAEKLLGAKKESGLTIYVGRYCSHKTLGVCTAHKKAYCTFQSKLSKIIQQQGRQGQLGIGFGSGESPNCRGLTPDQLSHVNFDKIDFSEYYADLEAKEHITEPAVVNQKIQDEINQMYKPS